MTSSYAVRLRATILALVTLVIASSSLVAQWSNLTPLPSPRTWAQQAILNDKLYSFGGINGSATAAEAWVLDLNDVDAGWMSIAPMPETRYGGFAGVHNGKIYIIAGGAREGSTINSRPTVFEYDPTLDSYLAKTDMPTGSWLGGYTQLGSKAYAIGGSVIVGGGIAGLDDTQIYDMQTDTWTTGSPVAGNYVQGNAAAIGNDVYYFGGLAITSSGGAMQAQTFKLTDGVGSWNAVSGGNLPTQVYSSAAGSVAGKIYIAGGSNNQNIAVSNVQVFDPSTNRWSAYFPLAAPSVNTNPLTSDGTSLYIAGGSSNTVQKLSIGAAKAIASVTPTTLHMAAAVGANAVKTIKLSNLGVATLTGTLSVAPSSPWLTISGSSISIAAGGSRQYQLTAKGAGLTAGVHMGTLNVNTNDPDNPTIPVTVNFHVLEQMVQQPTTVVMEEATGSWCGPCGSAGTPEVRRLKGIYQDRLITIALHDRGGVYQDPMATTATEGLNNKFGVQYFPSAVIQRTDWVTTPGLWVLREGWAAAIESALSQTPNAPAALEILEYAYAPTTRRVTAKLKISTADVISMENGELRLTAVVTEDSINSPQYQGTENPYFHMHVARSFWPDIHGHAIALPADVTDEAGTVVLPGKDIIVDVAFTVSGVTRPDYADVVWILNTGDQTRIGPVLQAAEIHLTATGGGGGNTSVIAVTADAPVKNVAVGATAEFRTVVTNISDGPISVDVDRVSNTLPSGEWNSRLCIGDDCNAIGTNRISTTILPDQSVTFKVKVLGGSPNATGVVGIRIAVGDTSVSQTYTTNSGDGVGGVDAETGASNMLSVMAYPNPISGAARVEFFVPTTGVATVNLFTTSGEKILSIFDGTRESGRHTANVDMSQIPAGVYSVVLTTGGRSTSRTITIVH